MSLVLESRLQARETLSLVLLIMSKIRIRVAGGGQFGTAKEARTILQCQNRLKWGHIGKQAWGNAMIEAGKCCDESRVLLNQFSINAKLKLES